MNAMAEIDLAHPHIPTAPTEASPLREASESYPKVVVSLSPSHRVIECRDGIQWIIQRRKKCGNDRAWVGRSYCTTRHALIGLVEGLEPQLGPKARQVLHALPRRLP